MHRVAQGQTRREEFQLAGQEGWRGVGGRKWHALEYHGQRSVRFCTVSHTCCAVRCFVRR